MDDFWEHGLPAYYEIIIDQRYVIALTYFTNVDPEKPFVDEFEIIKHPKKNLIGLVRKAEPKMLLMMHNFDTNENWPRANFYGNICERSKKRKFDAKFVKSILTFIYRIDLNWDFSDRFRILV